MDKENTFKIKKKLSRNLDAYRYEHTLGVSYTAVWLSIIYKEDIKKAELAGLLHDCAKAYKPDKLYKMALKYNININESEKAFPALLHAKIGAFLAVKEYNIDDKEIIDAIICHTTGKPDMSMLEKIIYVSDYIEPTRTKLPRLSQIRETAFVDLDKALLMILEDTVNHLKNKKSVIDPLTIQTYDYYKEIIK